MKLTVARLVASTLLAVTAGVVPHESSIAGTEETGFVREPV